ncbi:MAG: glycosyltransferase family 2 protein, partial [Pseudomonadota bacterium]
MIQRSGIAVVTICRDDAFFLQRFVDYYGGLFGRRHLYVISHGDTDMVRQVAEGTNIFPVPAIKTSKFNMLHWRTKNGLLSALRQWYAHVIVVDVDEFIVVDPATGHNLKSWLETAKTGTVYSPFGLEPVHLRSKEPDPVSDHIIGPRMHAQVAFHYAKPCIISTRAHLSRGG